ncbi:MAG TPA: hypothetical protein PLY87_21940 [Planctomycetaceae bacterium]|nr:hypothetical protein [Planctomycetaceae bacterium]HQZ67774.1 hypothetical protein [Planctomycetaceae bacterium]
MPNDTIEEPQSAQNRKPRFNKSDIAIFVIFPAVLVAGFLLFMRLHRTAADPNLKLVAQVTPDISVELVAVASQSRQKDGSIKWWKPNGLPASGIEDNPKGTTFGTADPGYYFLYKYKDDRPGGKLLLGHFLSGGQGCSFYSDETKKTVVAIGNAKPDIWNTVQLAFGLSTQGILEFGELTPEQPKLSAIVGGLIATAEVLSGKQLENVVKFRPSPCVLKITESGWKGNSHFSVEVLDEAGKQDTSVSMELGSNNNEYQHLYYFNSPTWSKIIIHRKVYDVHVKFECISSQFDSITSPCVGEISKLKDK